MNFKSLKNFSEPFVLICFIIFPLIGLASHAGIPPSDGCPYLVALIDHIAIIIAAVVGALATIMLLIAAFYYMTAGDDAQKVKKAHQTIAWAVVGLVVALLSGAVVSIVQSLIGNVVFGCP